jgi:26S proteasome regulatory subunit N7
MDCDFKEPTLLLHSLIHASKAGDQKAREELKSALLEKAMYDLYKHLIDRGVLEYNQEHLEHMMKTKEERIGEIEGLREKEPENDSYQRSVDRQLAEFYAQTLDLKKALEAMRLLTIEEASLSLKMDVFLCKIRMAVILGNRRLLEESVAQADEMCELGCDWDRRNKYKIYRAVYNLMRTDFKESAELISETLPSFECGEVLSSGKAVVCLIFAGLLTFGREDIRKRILESSEVLDTGNEAGLELTRALYDCDYGRYMERLYAFCSEVERDVFLGRYVGYFCKEMKLRAYGQILESYVSLTLENMAGTFGVEERFLERDLFRFIVEGRLRCKIDKIAGVVEIDGAVGDGMERVLSNSNVLIRKIKKFIK